MTIDELLLQFNKSDIQEILNDVPGKTLVKFNGNYFYADCEDGIIQFLALYDINTKIIKGIKLYGFNMRKALKYIQEHSTFLWCPVIHYIQDVYSPAPSITIITSL